MTETDTHLYVSSAKRRANSLSAPPYIVLVTGAANGIGKEVALQYAERSIQSEPTVLILIDQMQTVDDTARACTASSNYVRVVAIHADLTHMHDGAILRQVASTCDSVPIARVFLIHGELALGVSSRRPDADNLRKRLMASNYESYRQLTNGLQHAGLLSATVTRIAFTSSAIVFERSALSRDLLGINAYIDSKREMTRWALAVELAVLSKTICYPMSNDTHMTRGLTQLASNDPVRLAIVDGRFKTSSLGLSPIPYEKILFDPRITAQNLILAVEAGRLRAFTLGLIDEFLFRWWFSAVPGAGAWFLNFSEVFLFSRASSTEVAAFLLSAPYYVLVLYLPVSWPILFVLHWFPLAGNYAMPLGATPWEAPLRSVRAILGTYAFAELTLAMVPFVNFTLTGVVVRGLSALSSALL